MSEPGTNSCLRAVVLAAGRGKRLYPHTASRPKPLVHVSGRPIIDWTLDSLDRVGIREVVIVAGYRAEQLREALLKWQQKFTVHFVISEEFDSTNNIYSLWLARDWLCDDLLLLEADLIFDDEVLTGPLREPKGTNVAAVSVREPHMSGACVDIDPGGTRISRLSYPTAFETDRTYKTVNIYRLSSDFCTSELVPALDARISGGDTNCYYEDVFREAIESGRSTFQASITPASMWFEIDNDDDLERVAFGKCDPSARLRKIEEEYGGYWRYPVVDHRLLFNLHYPPNGLYRLLADRLVPLVKHYPAGQAAIVRFLAGYVGINDAMLAVGNGASEFIRILARLFPGPLIVPVPAFEEYLNSAPDRVIRLPLDEDNRFELDPQQFVREAIANGAKTAVLINPNNPTGNALSPDLIMSIVGQLAVRGIRVVLDESFIDFHPEGEAASLLRTIQDLPSLVIVKSLSKSHGISGIRLGFLASGDKALVRSVRRELPIWNVNGLGEEYLRLASAYVEEFRASCRKVRLETDAMMVQLGAIPGITTFPTAANFVFAKLDATQGDASALEATLMARESILIKSCHGKAMRDAAQFFRVASRTSGENDRLVRAIASYVGPRAAALAELPPTPCTP